MNVPFVLPESAIEKTLFSYVIWACSRETLPSPGKLRSQSARPNLNGTRLIEATFPIDPLSRESSTVNVLDGSSPVGTSNIVFVAAGPVCGLDGALPFVHLGV